MMEQKLSQTTNTAGKLVCDDSNKFGGSEIVSKISSRQFSIRSLLIVTFFAAILATYSIQLLQRPTGDVEKTIETLRLRIEPNSAADISLRKPTNGTTNGRQTGQADFDRLRTDGAWTGSLVLG